MVCRIGNEGVPSILSLLSLDSIIILSYSLCVPKMSEILLCLSSSDAFFLTSLEKFEIVTQLRNYKLCGWYFGIWRAWFRLPDLQKHKKAEGGCLHSLQQCPGDILPNASIPGVLLVSLHYRDQWLIDKVGHTLPINLAKWQLWVVGTAGKALIGEGLCLSLLQKLPFSAVRLECQWFFMTWFYVICFCSLYEFILNHVDI